MPKFDLDLTYKWCRHEKYQLPLNSVYKHHYQINFWTLAKYVNDNQKRGCQTIIQG